MVTVAQVRACTERMCQSLPYHQTIARVPLRLFPHVVLETFLGFFRRAREKGLPPSEELARDFFRERAHANQFEDFTDAQSDWYLDVLLRAPLLQRLIHDGDRELDVVDLGCGRGGLLLWLREHARRPVRYVGVDQDEGVIRACQTLSSPSAEFICADVQHLTDTFADADVMFAVNLFPYVVDAGGTLRRWRCLARPTSVLVVLDPRESLYWEREFGGFSLTFRDVSQWSDIAADAGWSVAGIASLSLWAPFGRRLGQLANAIIMRVASDGAPNLD